METPEPNAVSAPGLLTSIAFRSKEFQLKIAHGVPAAVARRAAARTLQAWELSHHADDALLVITELVQNVTQHTVSACQLRLALHRTALLIEVADGDPRPPAQRTPDLRSASGRGLHLIDAVAHRWGHRLMPYTDQPGKIVWAELALHPAD